MNDRKARFIIESLLPGDIVCFHVSFHYEDDSDDFDKLFAESNNFLVTKICKIYRRDKTKPVCVFGDNKIINYSVEFEALNKNGKHCESRLSDINSKVGDAKILKAIPYSKQTRSFADD